MRIGDDMKFTGTISDVSIDLGTNKPKITFIMNERNALDELYEIKDLEKLSIEAKKWRQKRSLDANAYCWVLINKLAEELNLKPIEVYKKAIRDIGVREIIPVKNEAIERYMDVWQKNGLGWLCETIPSKLNGYTNVVAWYGSSVYDSKEMSRLVDSIVEECKLQNIETLTPRELENMKESWGK
jgi:hypothetical protein